MGASGGSLLGIVSQWGRSGNPLKGPAGARRAGRRGRPLEDWAGAASQQCPGRGRSSGQWSVARKKGVRSRESRVGGVVRKSGNAPGLPWGWLRSLLQTGGGHFLPWKAVRKRPRIVGMVIAGTAWMRGMMRERRGTGDIDIWLPLEMGTSHTSPKRKRGKNLRSSLALRVGVISGREGQDWRGPQHGKMGGC